MSGKYWKLTMKAQYDEETSNVMNEGARRKNLWNVYGDWWTGFLSSVGSFYLDRGRPATTAPRALPTALPLFLVRLRNQPLEVGLPINALSSHFAKVFWHFFRNLASKR